MLTVVLYGYQGPERRIKVDFKRNRFTYFEWHLDSLSQDHLMHPSLEVWSTSRSSYSHSSAGNGRTITRQKVLLLMEQLGL